MQTNILQLDAEGRHEQAIEALRLASQQGDLTAMSELGHRLLVGDRAPKLPRHALTLLIGAARGGEPPVPHKCLDREQVATAKRPGLFTERAAGFRE